MKLYFFRHGETDHNVDRRIQGPLLDDPLNARGRAQAEALQLALKKDGLKLDAIYSSPLKRAFETAQAVARGTGGIEVRKVPGLIEFSWGEFLGQREEGDILAAMQELHRQWRGGRITSAPPKGESPWSAWLRAKSALDPILKQHPSGNVALVAHGRINKIVLAGLLHRDVSRMEDYPQGNTSVTLLERDDGAPPEGPWRLAYVNRKDHLSGDLADLPKGARPLV